MKLEMKLTSGQTEAYLAISPHLRGAWIAHEYALGRLRIKAPNSRQEILQELRKKAAYL